MSSSTEMGQMPSEPNLRAVRPEWIAKLPVELAKAQGEFEPPKRTKTAMIRSDKGSYEYKYADLADLVAAVQPSLTKYGIAWTQNALVEFLDGKLVVTVATRLYLGNEVLEFGPLMLPVGQGTPQGIGSAITYAKRYALSSALGVPSEADDDGQAAGQAGPQATSARLVTQRQIAAMHAAGSAKGVTHEKLHEWVAQNYGVESVKELTREQHAHIMDKIAELPDKPSDAQSDDAPARSEGTPEAPSDSQSSGTDQQAGEGPLSPAAGAPATKDEWAEIEKLVGSRREVVALYQDFFDHPKSVKVSDVTGEQLALLAAAYAEKQAPEAEGTS